MKKIFKMVVYDEYTKTINNNFKKKIEKIEIVIDYNEDKGKFLSVYSGKGLQYELSKKIENIILKTFKSKSTIQKQNKKYDIKNLNYRYDIYMKYINIEYYFEIEFRPNVEKDLIKFQMIYNTIHDKSKFIAVLIVANNKNDINPNYKSMTEYENTIKKINLINPDYNLIVINIIENK